jgi:hypothetical protein
MTNPSLKAQIEAAKSALKSGQAGTLIDQGLDDSTAPKAAPHTTPENKPSNLGVDGTPLSFGSNVATLDARITGLESKLAENQRDLYTLLGKIREVTRIQGDAAKNTGPRNTRPNVISLDDQNKTSHKGRRIGITLALLSGVIIVTGFLLATDFTDKLFRHLPIWIMQFVDFISNVVT